MNRPCFSLGVLLSSLAVCLLAVGSANCQTRLDLHTPTCMMCPYSGATYSGRSYVEHADPASIADAADDVDYDLDYQPQSDASKDNAETSTPEADYDYSDYDTDYTDTDYTDTDYTDTDYTDTDYTDTDYDYTDYDYTDYDYTDYDYDYTDDDYDYDYSDYDDSEQQDDDAGDDGASDTETLPQVDAGSTVNEAYDYSEYDYSDDEYSEYNDSEYNDSDYDGSEYGYSEYEYSGYGYSYDENLTVAGQADAPAESQVAESPSEAISESNSTSDEYGAFDNYDYEDYFAEVYGEDEVRAEVDASESSAAETSIVANEDVDAFDFFDQETFEPAAPEQDMMDDYDAYEYDEYGYDEYDYDAYAYDEYEYDAEAADYSNPTINGVAIETVKTEAESAVDDASAAALYDLETTYDAAYDEVMAPTVAAPVTQTQPTEAPAVETRDYSATDHCFGGYADPYRSEYRCDLADAYQVDAYQSFYHDGADPSASERETSSPVAENDDADLDVQAGVSEPFVTTAFPQLVEPYLAAAMDRVGAAWRQISLESLVSRAVTGMASLPVSFANDAKAGQLTSIGDYVDCHVDDCHVEAGNCDPNWCEIDCFGPWEPAQPIGSGVSNSSDSNLQPTDLQSTDAPTLDTAGLDKAKAAIRDLRSRMNAARQSPPLR